MDLGLKNKTAFVAASSEGLGLSVALALASEGAQVIICARNMEGLQEAKQQIDGLGPKQCSAFVCDLSNIASLRSTCQAVLKEFKKIDILVTNTGGPPSGSFEDFDLLDFQKAYDQLFASALFLIQQFLPGMKKQGFGRVISITSIAAKQPVKGLILSNSIRSGIAGLMKSLANEYGKYQITFNNVMPGYTKTKRLAQLIDTNPDFLEKTKDIPLKRFAEPEEFAAVVTFLASEKASYLTGSSLAIDGGCTQTIF
ncbi:SDR family oxidoreductase [Namhaeicola litoreus]|uniref:SDR family oxidoreductase n=1 Tax=Namhaeicola litoreus TaxID=1052145 RepID=A0ABW3Y4P5_9FLAO